MILHKMYTTSAAILQIKKTHNICVDNIAKRTNIDIKLIDRFIKGIEQMCLKTYMIFVKEFPEMKGRIDYE